MGNERYVGTTEDRINKWMRMCLHWQFDKRRDTERKASYYFTKYHVGKYPKRFFDDLSKNVVDRQYVINKMNEVSESRMIRDHSLGLNSNRVEIRERDNIPVGMVSTRIKEGNNTIVKYVGR